MKKISQNIKNYMNKSTTSTTSSSIQLSSASQNQWIQYNTSGTVGISTGSSTTTVWTQPITAGTFYFSAMTENYYYYVIEKDGNKLTRTISIDDEDVHLFFAIEKTKGFVQWNGNKETLAKINKLKFNAQLKKVMNLDATKEETGADTE